MLASHIIETKTAEYIWNNILSDFYESICSDCRDKYSSKILNSYLNILEKEIKSRVLVDDNLSLQYEFESFKNYREYKLKLMNEKDMYNIRELLDAEDTIISNYCYYDLIGKTDARGYVMPYEIANIYLYHGWADKLTNMPSDSTDKEVFDEFINLGNRKFDRSIKKYVTNQIYNSL